MGAWIDTPDWNSSLGMALRARLIALISTPEDIKVHLKRAHIPLGQHPFGAGSTAEMVWLSVTDKTASADLRVLLHHLQEAVPALAVDIARVLADQRPAAVGAWYSAQPPERARLLSTGGCRSLIARRDLGHQLRRLLADAGVQVLTVSGDPGMGKSHTVFLLDYLIEHGPYTWTKATLDVAFEWPPEEYSGGMVGVREFIERLASCLGLPGRFDSVVDQDDTKHLARDLARALVDRYTPDRPRQVLFLDGLDRHYLDIEPINVAVSYLAGRVVRGLPNLRMIITGYTGGLDAQFPERFADDWAGPLNDTELEEFFFDVGAQVERTPDAATVTRLVQRTLAGSTIADHAALGREASRVANQHFGAPA